MYIVHAVQLYQILSVQPNVDHLAQNSPREKLTNKRYITKGIIEETLRFVQEVLALLYCNRVFSIFTLQVHTICPGSLDRFYIESLYCLSRNT